jgi:hypothetical protein
VSHSRRRSSLRRDEGRFSSARARVCAVSLTALLAVAVYGPAAAAERSLQPDTSPGAAAAETGLQPDSFASSSARGAQIAPTAPALSVKTPPVHPLHVQTIPVEPKLQVAETPPAVHVSPAPHVSVAAPATRGVDKAAPRRHHVAPVAHRPARPHVAPPVALLALRGTFVFAALRGSVANAGPTLEAAVGNRGLALPAALAFLVLAAASGSFLSLAYRLRREQVEV